MPAPAPPWSNLPMRWYIPDKTWIVAPPFERDALYQEAVAWAREFAPEPDKDSYGAALQHASQVYHQSLSYFLLLLSIAF
jgi:hypothetical protein